MELNTILLYIRGANTQDEIFYISKKFTNVLTLIYYIVHTNYKRDVLNNINEFSLTHIFVMPRRDNNLFAL